MTVDDLPPGDNNSYVLTPKYSMENNVHVSDILSLLKERESHLGVKLYVYVEIVQKGLQFTWDTNPFPEDS